MGTLKHDPLSKSSHQSRSSSYPTLPKHNNRMLSMILPGNKWTLAKNELRVKIGFGA